MLTQITLEAVFECDFDSGTCGFTQDTTDDLNFVRHSGSTPTTGTGPSGDHTSGSGHYMYMEASDAEFGEKARLISPVFNATDVDDEDEEVVSARVTFWVYMNGEEMGTLRLLKKDVSQANPEQLQQVLVINGIQGNQWVRKQAYVNSTRNFHIVFEAIRGAATTSDIAIDDVTVEDDVVIEVIVTAPPPLEEFNCTFEGDVPCGFRQMNDDNFNVVKQVAGENGNPHSSQKDHSLGTAAGTYSSVDRYRPYSYWSSYARSSNSHHPGEKARIISPMLSGVEEGEDPACLLFWYHMHGDDVGELSVYIKNETSEGLGNPVWYLSGERGQVWRPAEIRINELQHFQIVFEFTAGQFENMAIDDISVTRTTCPGEHPVALEPTVSCDFSEAELCYYTHDPTSESSWQWTNRATDSSFTGPTQDHTRGDELGFYVHLDSNGHRAGSKARLISPIIEEQLRPSCLVFWYHMYGSHIGKLNVYAKVNGSALPRRPVWQMTGNQGQRWHRASVELSTVRRKFFVVFEGVLGPDYRSDIALDDVQFYPNSVCAKFSTEAPPVTTLPPSVETFRCDFETDDCGFTQATDDIMDWSRGTVSQFLRELNGDWRFDNRYTLSWGGYRRQLRGPTIDKTTNSEDGYILAASNRRYNPYHRQFDSTRVISPLIAPSSQPRCLQFFAYKEKRGFVNVYLREYGETRTIDPEFAYYWRMNWWPNVRVDIPASERPFNIIFEAMIPWPYSGGMITAIDDVRVYYGTCKRRPEQDGSCDFEDGMCGYRKRQWIRHSGETPSKGTGPYADHTFGNATGHYMYFEASQPSDPFEENSLSSPWVHFTGKQCLRFYYHASGNDTRRFQVILREPAQFAASTLFTAEGKQKDAWIPVNVDLDVSGDYVLVFKAFGARGYKADVAVDDIMILPHPCIDLPSEMSCDFELGPVKCGLENSRQNIVDWKWFDAVFGRNYPLSSRSTDTNSFMYLTSAPSSTNTKQQSKFLSRHLNVSPSKGDLCVSFEYFIQGNSAQTIVVSALEKGGNERFVGSLSDKNMTEWKMTTWSLLSSKMLRPFVVYQIVIAVRPPADGAVVAIDNLIVSSEACRSLGKQTPAPVSRRGRGSGGMAAGVTLFVIIVVVALCIVCFLYRARLLSMARRCTQRVTELNYKRHDVAFVNEEKKEAVEIPTISSLEPESVNAIATGVPDDLQKNI
ncbi:MAM and LDL-receptor class A domain-containing protein 1-like [Diadema antillarum]|uniref:MAM and LDL-receptor class A domain-containing protein 1-like n=1 Tax=Diadema antillarum TaxID=105358 RepID=UPI003A896CC9